MKNNLITLALSTLFLTACGGGSEDAPTSPPATTTKISGKAIDGYIVGATAFLDKNFNNVLDEGEPSVITTESGTFDIKLTGADALCTDYAPIVVDVPVGAIDETEGEVTEAYQMVVPPRGVLFTDEHLTNVTPLTTVLWSQVEAELKGDSQELNCESLRASDTLRENMASSLSTVSWAMASHYNIEPADLLSDYVADDNQALYDHASSLVSGLQKSYELTRALQLANPQAFNVLVSIYLGEQASWLMDEYVWAETRWSLKQSALDADFVVTKVLNDEVTTAETSDGLYAEFTVGFENTSATAQCKKREIISAVQSDTKLGIVNSGSVAATTEVQASDCASMDLASNVSSRSISNDVKTATTETFNDWMYTATPFPSSNLDDLIDMQGKLDTVDSALILYELGGYTIEFTNEDQYGADSMFRTLYSTINGKFAQTYYNELGNWYRRLNNESGTYTAFCGTSQASLVATELDMNSCLRPE